MTLLPDHINISAASEALLGLSRLRPRHGATTLYLLLGNSCTGACAFCSMGSHGGADYLGRTGVRLSRVDWPSRSVNTLLEALERLKASSDLAADNPDDGFISRPGENIMPGRICIQAVRDMKDRVLGLMSLLGKFGVPMSVSAHVQDKFDVDDYIAAGADRVGISLDAASNLVYERIKSSGEAASDAVKTEFDSRMGLIANCAAAWPGKITTHLIRGIGEGEQEFFETMATLIEWGAEVGLFAFTPLPGTPMSNSPRPDIASYRRLQLARFLMAESILARDEVVLSRGVISDLSLSENQKNIISVAIENNSLALAFRTSGCPQCNRPYYNEGVMEVPYNYPVQPDASSLRSAIEMTGLSALTSLF
ncbi:MAG: hypothetical protein CVV64_02695 [Candidatus Wallbacteria bacterium HGW-Wallbacteria-1]|jgi:biotin synthase|uniref:Radical SAM core domain-containing protein n=1 Tax=Candidatus Wallbacteria bacterium HGW-Wallbacteria-1 TaxID=2013854 RepID=A0A2N1PTC6_9BACT|nr:MAG: hypothetical protein CVV64_02695 [Candidatus Wallbacteria bacterium HGW-Wallbacteria-1]